MTPTDPALMTAEDLLGLYARGALSPVEALQAVTERIARLNPRLNAFAVMNPHSLAAAGESAARWRAGRPLGELDGVPVTVKDLVDVAGLPTRRGSRLTDAAPVAEDAPLVTGLRAAGAVMIGRPVSKPATLRPNTRAASITSATTAAVSAAFVAISWATP